ncbi:MAG: hypothetical protein IB616_01965 [Methanosarcinales archaeon]|nr:MAG: hypothetical protein IB616_01965 [Methanosarcinales archaeon]
MTLEMRAESPLRGTIDFYQAAEKFTRYCSMCQNSKCVADKVFYSREARENLDIAYGEYLGNFPVIFSTKDGVKPMPVSMEIKTEELKRSLEAQLASLDKQKIKKYLSALNNIKKYCPGNCDYKKVKKDVEKIKKLAEGVKKATETIYLDDLLNITRKQLKEAAEDPEKFKSMFPMPPKPLEIEYRG